MRKWMFCCALLLCLWAFALPCYATSATPPEIPTEGDVWDGLIERPTKIVQKDGVNYYEITKCSQLAYVAQTGGEWLARNYLLANNLILNNVVLRWDENGNLNANYAPLRKWTPIGGYSNPFTGAFDGAGFIISGMCVVQNDSYVGLFGDSKEMVKNVTVVNSYVSGSSYVGGIVGHCHGTTECVFSGIVKGSYNVGGISGTESSTNHCINYGTIIGISNVGGIGNYEYYNGTNASAYCENYGTITGTSKVGGIEGSGGAFYCRNHGTITGGDTIGGIVGSGYARCCSNYGEVIGESYVGGISGYGKGGNCNDCYNNAKIEGASCVGGIIGSIGGSSFRDSSNCYNIGEVVCTVAENNVGGIVGADGALWGQDDITGCYYLKTLTVNSNLYGCGGVPSSDMEPNGFFAKSADELKQQSTFEGWDFGETWRINEKYNNGYPYLAWERADDAPPLEGIALSQLALDLSKGDSSYLTALPIPGDAEAVSLAWTTSDRSVAMVNTNGYVTAVGVGTATITVSGGGFSTACAVTVKPRAADEYRIGALTVRDADGAALTAIPQGTFLVTIPITKQFDGGNSVIFLAAYSADGQFRGLLYVEIEDIPLGATVKVTLPVDNTNGEIAQLKAFTIASFSNPSPLGTVVCFPVQ